jgi:Flp pilus assembly protein TadG
LTRFFADGFTTHLAASGEMGGTTSFAGSRMSVTTIFNRIRTAACRFAGADQGNIAVIFAIAAVPILSFVGAAIDYSRANSARSSLQAALDSTALMVSRDLTNGTISTSEIEAKAKTYFSSLYTGKFGTVSTNDIHATYTPKDSSGISTIRITGSGKMPTDFMKIAGFPTLDFGSSSTSAWGNTRMRVAMVLDNTGSMAQNGKMAAMQKAAKDMIDTLSGYNKQDGDVYISVIPFAKDVNVGTSNVDAPWINWTEWEAEPPILNDKTTTANAAFRSAKADSTCPFTNSTHGFVCMDRPATTSGARTVSRIPANGYICPGLDNGRKFPGKANIYYNGCYTTVTGASASCGSFGPDRCSCDGSGSSKICHFWRGDDTAATAAARPAHSTWTGCVNDRDQDFDTKNTDPGSAVNDGTPSKRFYAEQWSQCLPATVTPMSNQWETLKQQITDMYPSGNTNQAVGLAWGWQSLSTTNGPIAAKPKASDYVYKDYIVLLSDGLNTQNRWSTSQSSIDARQKILCDNIKLDTTNPVTVFTIQVNINNADPKSQVLQDCAINGTFQMITTPDQTSDAFKNILTQISRLRVAK